MIADEGYIIHVGLRSCPKRLDHGELLQSW